MKQKLYAATGIIMLCVAFQNFARAAEFKVEPDPDGQVSIQMKGDIEEGDEKKFKAIAAKYSDAIVFLESDGGATLAALEIGRTIRAKGYTTAVIDNADCVSACGLIWLAGTPKAMTRHGRVGFHASYTDEDGKLLESGVANALVGRYLTQLDLPEEAVIFTTLAAPAELNWLTADNYKEAGIDAKIIDLDSNDENTAAPAPKSEPQKSEESAGNSDKRETASPSDDVEMLTKIGSWSIGVDKTLGNSCFMLASYESGTQFRIGFDASEDFSSYFLFGNDAWTYLKADQKYDLSFKLGGNTPWSVPTTAVDMDGVNMLMGYFTDSDFWDEFTASANLVISNKQKAMATLDLEGSAKAYAALVTCQKEQHPRSASGRRTLGTPSQD